MNRLRNLLLTSINRIGRLIPKRLQRSIADSRFFLKIFENLSRGDLMTISTPEGGGLLINPLFHSNLIQSGGLIGYEPEIRKILMKYTKPGMVAYDIGANVGVFSFLFSSVVGHNGIVYAFEPEEINYQCFEKSLSQHENKNIILDKRAVGKAKSMEEFDRRGGAFSGRLIGHGHYQTTTNIKLVETISIDEVVYQEGYRTPDIMKIDVEGNEGMVLEGMQKLLNKHHPIIICELHTHLGESSDQVIGLLSSYGYTISNINNALADNKLTNLAPEELVGTHIIAMK